MIPDDEPLAFPAPAPPPRAAPFPLVAALAPLAASAALWAITRSPLALVFALLGPLVALASFVDGRRHRRSAQRRAEAERSAALRDLERRVERKHDELRNTRRRQTPATASIVSPTGAGGLPWPSTGPGGLEICLGSGSAPSGLTIRGDARGDGERALRERAAILEDSLVGVRLDRGIAFVGPPVLTRAAVRACLAQLAHRVSPESMRIASAPAEGWGWAESLPHWSGAFVAHAAARTVEPLRVALVEGGTGTRPSDGDLVIAMALSEDEVPVGLRPVVTIRGPRGATVLAADGSESSVRPELLAEETARRFAVSLRDRARAAGLRAGPDELPSRLSFGDLVPSATGAGTLAATVGVGADGPLTLDLVTEGPHALVGGTTGSGKSEFLITWITAMAAARSPSELNLLLVDFKGGSSFEALRGLPHCVGVLTDLEHGEADRALGSLSAEIRFREGVLAERGVRDIGGENAGLARLVIVVDEFAAMLDAFPELHGLFADLAARGRSLGIHVVLCTQRPAGIVKDSLMANCALRISLRVNNEADSRAVVGSGTAARFTSGLPGRCVVARDGVELVAQVAVTEPDDIAAVAAAPPRQSPPRRPWLAPLGTEIPLGELGAAPPGWVVFGVEDRPDEQEQPVCRYPLSDGPVLVIGGRGSGKSTLIAALGAQRDDPDDRVVVPGDVEGGWDAMVGLGEAVMAGQGDGRQRLVLIDDLDSLLERFGGEHAAVVADALVRLLRDGSSAGLTVVATVQRLTPALRAAVPLFAETMVLPLPSKQDHVLAGAPPRLYDSRRLPGRAVWRDHVLQLAFAPASGNAARARRGRAAAAPCTAGPGGVRAIVTRSPTATAARLVAGGAVVVNLAENPITVTGGPDAGTVYVGEPESWLAQWAALGTLRRGGGVVFERCEVVDLRSVLRVRTLPPPLDPIGSSAWMVDEAGAVRRCIPPDARPTLET